MCDSASISTTTWWDYLPKKHPQKTIFDSHHGVQILSLQIGEPIMFKLDRKNGWKQPATAELWIHALNTPTIWEHLQGASWDAICTTSSHATSLSWTSQLMSPEPVTAQPSLSLKQQLPSLAHRLQAPAKQTQSPATSAGCQATTAAILTCMSLDTVKRNGRKIINSARFQD